MTLVGIFTPWITNNISDSGLSGWDLTSGDKGFLLPSGSLLSFDSKDPYLILVLGIAALAIGAILFVGAARTVARIAAVVVGIAIIVVLALDWSSMADLVTKNAPGSFEISAGLGFYLTGVGAVLTGLGALPPAKRSS